MFWKGQRRAALLVLCGLHLYHTLANSDVDVDVDHDTCAIELPDVSEDSDSSPTELSSLSATNTIEHRQHPPEETRHTRKESNLPAEDLPQRFNELRRKFELQSFELEWTASQLNETNRRLGVAEALLDELQSDLQAIQSKLMCNDRGQWQVTPKCRCIFTIISQAGETFAGFVEGCKLRCDLRVLLCRFQRRDMQLKFETDSSYIRLGHAVPADGTTHLAVALWGAGGGASPYADCDD
eukprot:4074152-Pyramimonas_sp.AAC.1